MPKFLLSPQVRRSLIQIGEYTLENFGQQQKKKYLTLLRNRMRDAAKNPDQGQTRSEIKKSYCSISAGKHHIYYRVRDTHIEIIDVLHQSMEPSLHINV